MSSIRRRHITVDETDDAIAEINIIPLVDVVLVLLIIFMVTTVFAHNNNSDIKLPKGSRADQMKQPPVEITIAVDKKARIFVNGIPTKIDDVCFRINTLKSKDDRNSLLVVRGDKDVLYGDIIPVLDQIGQSGVKMTLALEPQEKKK
ncbi:MAG: biopolymer transporter ExbD [bacterium]